MIPACLSQHALHRVNHRHIPTEALQALQESRLVVNAVSPDGSPAQYRVLRARKGYWVAVEREGSVLTIIFVADTQAPSRWFAHRLQNRQELPRVLNAPPQTTWREALTAELGALWC